jgi:hypothetical protein
VYCVAEVCYSETQKHDLLGLSSIVQRCQLMREQYLV